MGGQRGQEGGDGQTMEMEEMARSQSKEEAAMSPLGCAISTVRR